MKAEKWFNVAVTLAIVASLIGAPADLYGAPTLSLGFLFAFGLGFVMLIVVAILAALVARKHLDEDTCFSIGTTAAVICLTGVLGSLAVYLWAIYEPAAIASGILAFFCGAIAVQGGMIPNQADKGWDDVFVLGIFFS